MPATTFSVEIATGLRVEDHSSEFYLITGGDGHDFTLSLETPVAERLARFILDRIARRDRSEPCWGEEP